MLKLQLVRAPTSEEYRPLLTRHKEWTRLQEGLLWHPTWSHALCWRADHVLVHDGNGACLTHVGYHSGLEISRQHPAVRPLFHAQQILLVSSSSRVPPRLAVGPCTQHHCRSAKLSLKPQVIHPYIQVCMHKRVRGRVCAHLHRSVCECECLHVLARARVYVRLE